ncbi:MAG: 30S ribosomal protein S7 [Chlamydiae bacterium]|nr:30S ribosomal protein S7 [Chlamydiota bacterium]
MARRRRAQKRKIELDPRFKSALVSKFINKVMLDGKKSTARTIVYEAIEALGAKFPAEDPLIVFEQALENAKPSLEVKSRRIGGATYQVPVEIASERRASLAMKWVITFAREKPGKSMKDGLYMELADCYQNQGSSIKKKDDTHKMAEANKAFAHYKW